MSRWVYVKNTLPKEDKPVYIAFIKENDPFDEGEEDVFVTTGCRRNNNWLITTACTINGNPYVGRTIDTEYNVYAWKELDYPCAPNTPSNEFWFSKILNRQTKNKTAPQKVVLYLTELSSNEPFTKKQIREATGLNIGQLNNALSNKAIKQFFEKCKIGPGKYIKVPMN